MIFSFLHNVYSWLVYKWFNWTGTASGVALASFEELKAYPAGTYIVLAVGIVSVLKGVFQLVHENRKAAQELKQDKEKHDSELAHTEAMRALELEHTKKKLEDPHI